MVREIIRFLRLLANTDIEGLDLRAALGIAQYI